MIKTKKKMVPDEEKKFKRNGIKSYNLKIKSINYQKKAQKIHIKQK